MAATTLVMAVPPALLYHLSQAIRQNNFPPCFEHRFTSTIDQYSVVFKVLWHFLLQSSWRMFVPFCFVFLQGVLSGMWFSGCGCVTYRMRLQLLTLFRTGGLFPSTHYLVFLVQEFEQLNNFTRTRSRLWNMTLCNLTWHWIGFMLHCFMMLEAFVSSC